MTDNRLRDIVETAARRAEDNLGYLIIAQERIVFSRELAR